jgi:hypothetical protein
MARPPRSYAAIFAATKSLEAHILARPAEAAVMFKIIAFICASIETFLRREA